MIENEIDLNAQRIWDYHHLHHNLKKADCLFVLGSHDLRVADYAAQLYTEGWAPFLMISGGIAHSSDLLHTDWNRSEAEVFAEKAVTRGVPQDRILLETHATNTGENVTLSDRILKEKNIDVNRVIALQKPYMERRTYATLKVHWPEKEVIVSSPGISFSNYPNDEISKDELINIMVGDLQRIKIYPDKGYQIHQDIPFPVWDAYKILISLGFNKHLIRE